MRRARVPRAEIDPVVVDPGSTRSGAGAVETALTGALTGSRVRRLRLRAFTLRPKNFGATQVISADEALGATFAR